MNRAETHALLTAIAAVDNRKVADETVLTWHRILADLDYTDAQAAVETHFAETTEYLMPVHIRRGAHRAARARQDALYAAGWPCRRCGVDNRADAGACRQCGADPHPAIGARDRSAEVAELLREIRDRLPPMPAMSPLRRPEVARWDADRTRHHRADAGPNPLYEPTTTRVVDTNPEDR